MPEKCQHSGLALERCSVEDFGQSTFCAGNWGLRRGGSDRQASPARGRARQRGGAVQGARLEAPCTLRCSWLPDCPSWCNG